MENAKTLYEQLEQTIRQENEAGLLTLKSENGRLKAQLEGYQDRLEKLRKVEDIFKRVEGWKEKTLAIDITDRELSATIVAFADRYGWEAETFLSMVVSALFNTNDGMQLLAYLINRMAGQQQEAA